MWAQLGIGKAISRVAGRGRGRSGVERAIFTMVCQRCLEPASKLEATRWLGRDVVIDGIAAVSDDELYRAMDFLLACSERVQESVFFSVANLLNLEVDVIFFDTTSTYFEVDVDDRAMTPTPSESRPARSGRCGGSGTRRITGPTCRRW